MQKQIQLKKIAKEDYSHYRYEVIFNAYKWDPQVEDANTVSEYVMVLTRQVANELAELAEKLAKETHLMEEEILSTLSYTKVLGLPASLSRKMKQAKNYQKEQHVRLMRFDFHPTTEGWQISEVNSDVPGGFAESSILPEIATRYISDTQTTTSFAEKLFDTFEKKIKSVGKIGLVHATSYADDRQVMQFIGDYFEERGYSPVYLAPDQLRFKNRQAFAMVGRRTEKLVAILRFFPLEWMPRLPFFSQWKGYYSTETPSCNHPVAMLTQSKRLPLLWDKLGVDCSLWRQLLPETKPVVHLEYEQSAFIYKPAFGRVGGDITIKEVVTSKEFVRIRREAKKRKNEWIVQKRFTSLPIQAEDQKLYHLCIGVFVIDGTFAGFYGRISPHARIDEKARDIPVLIKK